MAALLVFFLVAVLVIAHGAHKTTTKSASVEDDSYADPNTNKSANKEIEESQNSQNQPEKNSTPLNHKKEGKSTTVTNSENVSEINQRPNTPNEVNKGENNVLKERGNEHSNVQELKNSLNKAEISTALSHDEGGESTTVTNSENISKNNQRSNSNKPSGVNNVKHNTSETANTNLKDQEFHNSMIKATKLTPLNHKEERRTTTVMKSKNLRKTNLRPYDVNKGEHKNTSNTSMTNNKFTTTTKTKHSSDSNIASSTNTNSAKGNNYNKREVNDILNKPEKLGSTVVLPTYDYSSSPSSSNTTKTKTKTNLWGTFKKILIGSAGVIGFLGWGMYIVMSVL